MDLEGWIRPKDSLQTNPSGLKEVLKLKAVKTDK
jgi:hypothetical protein